MPRKGKQTTASRYGATKHRTRASITDLHDLNLGAKDALPRGHSSQIHPPRNTPGAIHTQVNTNGAAESSLSSLSADEEEDGGTGGSDTAGDDEEHNNGDDDDADALAPSGRSLGRNGRRAGLIDCVSAGMKRRRSPNSSEGEQLSRKVVRPIKRAAPLGGAKNLLGDSDDEEYNAVDFISDSDEEEPSVEQLEEKMIIDSEEANETDEKTPGPSAPSSVSSVEWEGFDLDDGIFLADIPFFDDEIGRTEPNVLGSEIDIHGVDALHTGEPLPSPTPRRVRFADAEQHQSSSSSTRASDAEDDAFPDLFLQQDSLDPYFRLLIENDNDAADGISVSDGEGSCWDFDEHENFELEKHGLDESSGSSCGSSSGYESELRQAPGTRRPRPCETNLTDLTCFQRTRARLLTRRSYRLLQLTALKLVSAARQHHPLLLKKAYLQLRSASRLRFPLLVATAHPWVHGSLTRRSQLQSSTVRASIWSSYLHNGQLKRTSCSPISVPVGVVQPTTAHAILSLDWQAVLTSPIMIAVTSPARNLWGQCMVREPM